MVAEFGELNLKALEISLQFESISPFILGGWPTFDAPDSWSVQRFGEATVVRLKEAPMLALTLRSSGDGSLLLDPGPLALQWAIWRDGQFASGIALGDLDYPSVPVLHAEVSPEEGHEFIFRNLSYDVMGIHRAPTRVEVTTRFELRRGLSGKLATGDIRWHTDTAEGRTDLLWTNAPLERDSGGDSWLQLFANPVGNDTTSYFFTVGLDDVPPGDEITVEFNDLTIGDTVLDLALTLPLANIPPGG